MKIIKIIAALILTIALYFIASSNSRGQSEFRIHTEDKYVFVFNTVPKAFEKSTADIPISVSGDFSSGQKVIFRKIKSGTDFNNLSVYEVLPTQISEPGFYNVTVQTGERGDRFYYYFEVVDSSGITLAKMTDENNQPFVFKYIGHVPLVVIGSHLLFIIFITPFFIALATTNSFSLITGATSDVKPTAKLILWSVICCFIGGYPIGFAMNWYAFDGFWEGIPFGTDATDNKTQILFVYIIFVMLAMWGSLRGNPKNNLYSPKTLGWLGVGSFVMMLAIYLIPHSIQFSKELTYSVCYSYTLLIIIIYVVGLIRNKSRAVTSQ